MHSWPLTTPYRLCPQGAQSYPQPALLHDLSSSCHWVTGHPHAYHQKPHIHLPGSAGATTGNRVDIQIFPANLIRCLVQEQFLICSFESLKGVGDVQSSNRRAAVGRCGSTPGSERNMGDRESRLVQGGTHEAPQQGGQWTEACSVKIPMERANDHEELRPVPPQGPRPQPLCCTPHSPLENSFPTFHSLTGKGNVSD